MTLLFGLLPIFQRAISVETGIQNTPLAFAIILLSFVYPIQSQMLWLAVLYASFIVMTSSIITLYYRRTGRFDWEVYKNTSVHNRLFGEAYTTSYPKGLPPQTHPRRHELGSGMNPFFILAKNESGNLVNG